MALERVATRCDTVSMIFLKMSFCAALRKAGIKNFERYKVLVDSWQLYDNSDAPPILMDES
jgi:hypothetical protein